MQKANLSWLFMLNVALLGVLFISLSKPSPVKSALAEHIVISEIQITGASANDEFVELYNPTDSDMNLAGWRLARKTSGTSSANLVTNMSGTIPAHGYFLVAPTTYAGSTPADLNYSPAATRISADNTVYLYASDSATLVDKVAIGEGASDGEGNPAPLPGSGQSIERKAKSTSTADSMTSGADVDQGNGEDTDENSTDFILRDISQPQDSTSSAEVLAAPSPSASASPSLEPSQEPSASPSASPSTEPSISPSPSASASASPSMSPSASPSATPTPTPPPSRPKLVCKFEPVKITFGRFEFTLFNFSCKWTNI